MPEATTKYRSQRRKVTPPHVSLHALRLATGMTIDELRDRIADVTGKKPPSRGAISALESGLRGASSDVLDSIALAYGLEPGSITTTYRPRLARPPVAAHEGAA